MYSKFSRIMYGLINLGGGVGLAAGLVMAADKPSAADNSSQNQIHDGERAVTAEQQKNNKTDTEITRKIRRSLTADNSLSTYAHNVKIITQNGIVVLKGPVNSEQEKTTVEAKASQVVGPTQLKSEIEVVKR